MWKNIARRPHQWRNQWRNQWVTPWRRAVVPDVASSLSLPRTPGNLTSGPVEPVECDGKCATAL